MRATAFHSRPVEQVVLGADVSDGAGVKLKRVLSGGLQQRLDPFLMLDEFGSDHPGDYLAGFPDHPHRGFETVTYMLDGRMRHRDSAGNEGVIGPGDVQWMTAGRGVVHSEMPEQQEGRMRGFQLWVNLPASEKMTAPRYRGLAAADIPVLTPQAGVSLKLIAGTFGDVTGAVTDICTRPLYADLALAAGTDFQLPLPAGHNAFLYVYEGAVQVGERRQPVGRGQLAVLANLPQADGVSWHADADTRLLLIAGAPIGEPVVQWGPFVMNSREEIEQAFDDYRNGRF